jgi:hypothetical protein
MSEIGCSSPEHGVVSPQASELEGNDQIEDVKECNDEYAAISDDLVELVTIGDFEVLSDDWMELVTIAELARREVHLRFPIVGANGDVFLVSPQEYPNEFLFDAHFLIPIIPPKCMLRKGLAVLDENRPNEQGHGMVKLEGYSGVWDASAITKCLNLFRAKEYMEQFAAAKEWLDILDKSHLPPIFAEKKANLLHTFENAPLKEEIAIISNST